jgi:CubicO group peptidase (beta-lactamase class C family)
VRGGGPDFNVLSRLRAYQFTSVAQQWRNNVAMRRRLIQIVLIASVVAAVTQPSPRIRARSDPDFTKVRDAALADITSGNVPGLPVLIVHEGRVVFAEGFGVASIETNSPVTPTRYSRSDLSERCSPPPPWSRPPRADSSC